MTQKALFIGPEDDEIVVMRNAVPPYPAIRAFPSDHKR